MAGYIGWPWGTRKQVRDKFEKIFFLAPIQAWMATWRDLEGKYFVFKDQYAIQGEFKKKIIVENYEFSTCK